MNNERDIIMNTQPYAEDLGICDSKGKAPMSAPVHPIVLLPCPFCGGKAEKIHLQHMGIDGYRIYCGGCHITTETMANRDSVVNRWNSRRTDGMIAWLDAEIEKCDESRVSGLSIRRGALLQCKKQLLKLLDGMGVE